ncbi:unnamed protein product [Angiostrongylus costaricensis]|uniref:DoxX family protein n=1 Tax=Angiostrongylus costaricensis TaxID=334426 RepID=A0A0R3PEQ7_ANGCS|nr:unnamed protein product [Angiostrongylus costaricensis]
MAHQSFHPSGVDKLVPVLLGRIRTTAFIVIKLL